MSRGLRYGFGASGGLGFTILPPARVCFEEMFKVFCQPKYRRV